MFEDQYKIPQGSRENRIRKNVMKRQELKRKWDKHCKYEADGMVAEFGANVGLENYEAINANYVRLLDEGVVVDGDGVAYAVIGKGAIKKWFDALPDDFIGYINKDHISAIELGTFTKSDLRLVELDEGRYGVDVNVELDDSLYAVKDLKRLMNRKAVSSEFYYNANKFITAEEATGDKKQGRYLIPVIDELSITGYAVVDNPKNANSYDEDLLEKASASDEFATNVTSEGEKMTEEETKAETVEEVEATEEAVEAEPETPAEETEAVAAEATEDEGEKTDASEGEESDSEAGEKEEESEDDKVEASAEKLAEAIKLLKADLKAKDDKIAKLEAKLSNSKVKQDEYKANLEKLFNFATADEPTEEEGSETPSEKEEDGEGATFVSALESAFKEMEG